MRELFGVTDDDPFNVQKKNQMKDAQVEVNDIRMQLITMLKQKSRNQWLVEGASNTSFFHNSIRMRRRKDSLFDIEHDSISVEESDFMDHLPSVKEIHEAIFGLGADSAPGLDEFAGFFYRERGANTLKNFRPIGLNNFFFKNFTKILATRMGSVLGNLVSEEEVAFMKGRNIHENISLCYLEFVLAISTFMCSKLLADVLQNASEMVNELQIKRKEGNVGLKLDITQAFDTILQILKSARIFALVNGSPEGNMKNLRNLVILLGSCQRASGQTFSREKSKIYYGGGSLRRRASIADFFGMNIVIFPDIYLGVKVMPGAVKYHHVSNVVEKIKEQLTGWKGRMLSFQDRVVLFKSVFASYSIHNMAV
ncbi:uncharacterized protein LOC113279484 [Papaver somniferum]|uniref:uncharacterized protein LOC113279484 n=1 Tax=Papaver somniferum TaxID=3469 RepID=UPI000E701065|nr:uncharacterized protein LOC113279484 [Papaver somniferum]